MAKHSSPHLDTVFNALAHPTRRTILERLADGEKTVGELAVVFDVALPTISKHIRVLEDAQLIHRRRMGREHYLGLEAGSIRLAAHYLMQYEQWWRETLGELGNYLAQEAEDEADDPDT